MSLNYEIRCSKDFRIAYVSYLFLTQDAADLLSFVGFT
jgi:hypothetical protein